MANINEDFQTPGLGQQQDIEAANPSLNVPGTTLRPGSTIRRISDQFTPLNVQRRLNEPLSARTGLGGGNMGGMGRGRGRTPTPAANVRFAPRPNLPNQAAQAFGGAAQQE